VGADAVYFAGETPLVYFKDCSSHGVDSVELAKFHKNAWNDSRVPLLIVLGPREVRIYDACAKPFIRDAAVSSEDDTRLILALELANKSLSDARLAPFCRQHVESGATWKEYPARFLNEWRCDRTLLGNLRVVSDQLQEGGLAQEIVHELLPRVILLLYLEHRQVLDKRFYSQFRSGSSKLVDVLNDHTATYRLFDTLAAHFNGDLLPVTSTERRHVKVAHLRLLSRLLGGTENLDTGQMALWQLYDFNVIPTELISSIYELFLRSEDGAEAEGLHYTPPALVEMLLNEVMPWPDRPPAADWKPPRVVDPACGSGIFLIEAYRRIIESLKAQQGLDRLPVDLLRDVLSNCIFGVDEVHAAVKVAAFSLYLAMLDYVQPKAIWQHVRFPKLTSAEDGHSPNLLASDAFEAQELLKRGPFDLVVGNPPWKRNYVSAPAQAYCEGRNLPIAREIAHAFLWLAADLAGQTGRVAMFATSKWLFNREGPDRRFREAFFARNQVETIINFSALRRSLFPSAVGPASAVVYSHRSESPPRNTPNDILYCAPQARRAGPIASALLVDAAEWKFVPDDLAAAPAVWKVLTWASWRDYRLFRKLRSNEETIARFIEARAGWSVANGFQPFDPKRNRAATATFMDRELERMPYLPADAITRHFVAKSAIHPSFGKDVTFRRAGHRAAYAASKIVVKEGQAGGRFCAAFVEDLCTFRATVTGIAAPKGDIRELKALTVFLNSSLASYFTFFNSTSWGVERERVSSNEWLGLPSVILHDDDTVVKLCELFDQIVESRNSAAVRKLEAKADVAVFQSLGLSATERTLVTDFVDVALPIIQRGSRPVRQASEVSMRAYLDACARQLSRLVPKVRATAWIGVSPLLVAEFRSSREGICEVRHGDEAVHEQLEQLDRFLIRQESESVFLRRHARISMGDAVYIVKPTDADLWTASAGLSDADEILADLLAQGSENSDVETVRR
jgi:hypothetical protein